MHRCFKISKVLMWFVDNKVSFLEDAVGDNSKDNCLTFALMYCILSNHVDGPYMYN